jgi:hypothetical protein
VLGDPSPLELPPLAVAAHAAFVLRASSLDPDAEPFAASPGGLEARLHFSDSEASFSNSDAPPPPGRGKAVYSRRPRRGDFMGDARHSPRPSPPAQRRLASIIVHPHACRCNQTRRGLGQCRAVGVGGASLRCGARCRPTFWGSASTTSPVTTSRRTARSRPSASTARTVVTRRVIARYRRRLALGRASGAARRAVFLVASGVPVDVAPRLAAVRRRTWPRHARCQLA